MPTKGKTGEASDAGRAAAAAFARAAKRVALGALVSASLVQPLGVAFASALRASSSNAAVPLLDTTPWLASVQAPKAPFFTRESDAEGVSFHFRNSGRSVPKGGEVIVSESPNGDMWLGAMVHATYIDDSGVATSGWLVRSHLRQVRTPVRQSAWDGHWRSSAGARRLIAHGDRVSYSFAGAGGAQPRVEMLMRMRRVSDAEATLSRMQASDGMCDLDVRRLGDYLVVTARDCFIPGVNPEGILRRRQ
ncbi:MULTISPECIES: hypothetical protein [unclassified Burkholderia]|uniref:hypothetical protein n=1 Tax=unclassified Burkholderia TaxID=2613784 RepID=UPI000757635B|nr:MULTISPECIES: hypothetical protein [unclassified Burkholderia]AOK47854.1 hypothetical protein WT60_14110 [Burkholderia sp. MSMB617WGS]KVK90648.1 hypothetical protein WS91_26450 [Burkholderia sp. MSMB1498]